nr:ribonuclease H-like domain-containing protein [Tanacetum cinerariifolium]
MGILIYYRPKETGIKYFLRDEIDTIMASGGSFMTSFEDINSFLAMHTLENNLIGTNSKQIRVISKMKYAIEILERAQMLNYNPCRTSVDTEKKVEHEGSPVTDPTLYRSLAGALYYLTFTRPDLSYAVQQLCLYMHDPREPYLNAIKCVLRYLRGTTDLGLQLFWFTTSQLTAYSDVDWAGYPATRRAEAEYHRVANAVAETSWIRNLLRELQTLLFTATLVYCDNVSAVYMSANLDTLSYSSAEAEYRRVANAVAETSWIRNLLRELQTPLFTATLVYCDNVSAVYMSANPVQH